MSEVSLEADRKVNASLENVQYEVLERPGQEPVLVEKIHFDQLLDFVYAGIQKEFASKQCLNCGRWLLQRLWTAFTYCDCIAPGERSAPAGKLGLPPAFMKQFFLRRGIAPKFVCYRRNYR